MVKNLYMGSCLNSIDLTIQPMTVSSYLLLWPEVVRHVVHPQFEQLFPAGSGCFAAPVKLSEAVIHLRFYVRRHPDQRTVTLGRSSYYPGVDLVFQGVDAFTQVENMPHVGNPLAAF
jgi:hypothetical protein